MRPRSRWLMVLLFAMSILPMTATAQTMIEAAEHGDTAGVERLIASGSPIDQANASGQTPLLLAVQNNHLAVASRLIDAGANINAQAANQDTPWLLAGALGRTAMLHYMLPKGPNFSIEIASAAMRSFLPASVLTSTRSPSS
jgi:ankyrin repeat protein